MDWNEVRIAGNLTTEPDLKRVGPKSTPRLAFSLAIHEVDFATKEKKTQFIDCVAWGRVAEVIADYAKKGSNLFLSGKLEKTGWEDPKTHEKKSATRVIVDKMQFAGSAGSGGERREESHQEYDEPPVDGSRNDDVPF